ncbi:YqaE/Pmp3 family membrane protein [Aquimarina agarivorans]|uniref:YqaE/Pmp3 family membrane protein n=1 Tax=Aquimarina agarivorans TaxID=980584 RepID=UPI0002F0B99D|nr:YqaE/Pmp3 family membrane protein [Aquimarina agarivorans]
MSLITILLNIFLPPLSVFLQKGLGSAFLINILLTLLGGLPGMIHAFLVTSKQPA